MRDFRHAKAMAHALRAALAAKGLKVTVGQSRELIAQAFGVADWNTLSAAIRALSAATHAETVGPSTDAAATLHRARACAIERGHPHETLEHLLLALIDDVDASAVMKGCEVDLGTLRDTLTHYVDNDLWRDRIARSRPWRAPPHGEPKRSAAFHRVLQRAAYRAEGQGGVWTGAELLLAILAETESHAARLLDQRGLTYEDAALFIDFIGTAEASTAVFIDLVGTAAASSATST